MNGVAECCTQLDWDAFVNSYSVDILARLRVHLMDKFVGVTFMKRPDCRLEILDVAFGPFEF